MPCGHPSPRGPRRTEDDGPGPFPGSPSHAGGGTNAGDAQTIVDEKTTALLDRIVEDNGLHGGLLGRETIRAG